MTLAIANAPKKFIPFFNKIGKVINRDNEGITNQNISVDKADILATSLVSKYKNIKAMIEINGSDAKMAPQKLLRLAISDISMIKNAELMILMM